MWAFGKVRTYNFENDNNKCQMTTHEFQAQRLILNAHIENQCLQSINISIIVTCVVVPLCLTTFMVTTAGSQLYHDQRTFTIHIV